MGEATRQPGIDAARLTAFADGELRAAEAAAVQAHLAAHPADAARVAAASRLRQGIAEALRADSPMASDALRERIVAMAETERQRPDRPEKTAPGLRASYSRWARGASLAVAAMMLLAIGLVAGPLLWSPQPTQIASPVPASLVANVTRVHVDCSRAPDLHTAAFPKRLGNLEGQLKEYLGRPVPYPDLRPIGYAYVGAGPCGKRAEQMVHLLYKSIRGPVTDTVSLFVQPYQGQVHVDEGQVYWAAGRDAAHPMIVWRKDAMVFYLVGDAEQPVAEAASLMHVKAPL